jgi:hypothetical protein
MKRCPWCLRTLSLDEFWLVRKGQPDRQDWCKACRRAWRWSYREIEREQDRARYHRTRALKAAQ